jgi:hypothetical protein
MLAPEIFNVGPSGWRLERTTLQVDLQPQQQLDQQQQLQHPMGRLDKMLKGIQANKNKTKTLRLIIDTDFFEEKK